VSRPHRHPDYLRTTKTILYNYNDYNHNLHDNINTSTTTVNTMTIRRLNFTARIEHQDFDDLILPISSFTARVRYGDPSYLQIVVPNYTLYQDDILDRVTHCRGCQIVIDKIRDEDTDNPYEVIRVDFENLRTDEGNRSQSVFMVGHRTYYNPSPTTVTLQDVDYIRTGIDVETGTDHRLRFTAYTNVTAGDTITYAIGNSTYSFQVQLLTLTATEYDFEQEVSST
jgi:hypothetical protein